MATTQFLKSDPSSFLVNHLLTENRPQESDESSSCTSSLFSDSSKAPDRDSCHRSLYFPSTSLEWSPLKTPGLLTKRLYSPFRKRMTKRLLSLRHVVRSPAKSRRQISKAKKKGTAPNFFSSYSYYVPNTCSLLKQSSTEGETLNPVI